MDSVVSSYHRLLNSDIFIMYLLLLLYKTLLHLLFDENASKILFRYDLLIPKLR